MLLVQNMTVLKANHASESALAELTAEAEQLRQEMQSVSESWKHWQGMLL